MDWTLWKGTYRLGEFGFSASHRPPRRLQGEVALQAELCRLQAEAASSATPIPEWGGNRSSEVSACGCAQGVGSGVEQAYKIRVGRLVAGSSAVV
jgi:hypothetical protein